MYEGNPAQIIDVSEDILLRRYPGSIATAFAAIVDTASCTITYANAGHPHPLMQLSNGTVTELSADGLPIGLRTQFGSSLPKTRTLTDADIVFFIPTELVKRPATRWAASRVCVKRSGVGRSRSCVTRLNSCLHRAWRVRRVTTLRSGDEFRQ